MTGKLLIAEHAGMPACQHARSVISLPDPFGDQKSRREHLNKCLRVSEWNRTWRTWAYLSMSGTECFLLFSSVPLSWGICKDRILRCVIRLLQVQCRVSSEQWREARLREKAVYIVLPCDGSRDRGGLFYRRCYSYVKGKIYCPRSVKWWHYSISRLSYYLWLRRLKTLEKKNVHDRKLQNTILPS